jgi:hypothetical protein
MSFTASSADGHTLVLVGAGMSVGMLRLRVDTNMLQPVFTLAADRQDASNITRGSGGDGGGAQVLYKRATGDPFPSSAHTDTVIRQSFTVTID